MTLGLNLNEPRVSSSMITSAETLSGFEIINMMGIVEGISEGSFPAISVGGVGVQKGGGLDRLVEDARAQISRAASEKGANGIVGFRYAIIGRDLEKSVLAYGTAVLCRRLEK
jgi:uncharacterized protein YbjQ (UPF0145 family)